MALDDRGYSLVETLIVTLVLVIAMGISTSLFVQGNRTYEGQRSYDEARSSAAAALDMTVRLLRSATLIVPDPDANLVTDSIRVVSDWNPRDGDTLDPYEDVTFTTAGGTLFKQEPADAAPVAYADRVASITFTYRNPGAFVIAAPWNVSQRQLALVTITVQSTPINGAQVAMTSSASVRRTE